MSDERGVFSLEVPCLKVMWVFKKKIYSLTHAKWGRKGKIEGKRKRCWVIS